MKIPAMGATAPHRQSNVGAAAAPPVVTGAQKAQYLFLDPDMSQAVLVDGLPTDGNPAAPLICRTIPGTLGFICTPNNTYLFVDPDNGVHLPKLAWTPVAAGLEKYGQYGNSFLFAPKFLDAQKLDPDTYKAVFGANKPNLDYQTATGFPLSAAQAAAQQAGADGNLVNAALALVQQAPSGFTPYLPGATPAAGGGFSPFIPPTGTIVPGGWGSPAQGGSSATPGFGEAAAGGTAKDESSSGGTALLALFGLGVVGLGIYAVTRR